MNSNQLWTRQKRRNNNSCWIQRRRSSISIKRLKLKNKRSLKRTNIKGFLFKKSIKRNNNTLWMRRRDIIKRSLRGMRKRYSWIMENGKLNEGIWLKDTIKGVEQFSRNVFWKRMRLLIHLRSQTNYSVWTMRRKNQVSFWSSTTKYKRLLKNLIPNERRWRMKRTKKNFLSFEGVRLKNKILFKQLKSKNEPSLKQPKEKRKQLFRGSILKKGPF